MLTLEQEQWIESLGSDGVITIVPYDPKSEQLFNTVKEKIINLLGPDAIVEHVGSSSFGISGQDEIDIAIITTGEKFPEYIRRLEPEFGLVRKRYPDRARFEVREDDKKIDLKMVDISHPNSVAGRTFQKYIKNHSNDLEQYRILKEKCNGMTVKEYYRVKTEFINEILAKA